MSKSVIIIGAGGHAKVVADIVEKSGDKVLGFLDDHFDKGQELLGYPILGHVDEVTQFKEHYFVVAIGDNYTRKFIADAYANIKFYTAIHPAAVIGLDVEIGEGTVIMANAVINPSTNIGNHSIINTSSVIEHDNVLDDFVHVSPKAVTGGGVYIGTLSHIGIGVTVKNNISIIRESIIGAGSVVVKNIIEKGTYVGVPATLLNRFELVKK